MSIDTVICFVDPGPESQLHSWSVIPRKNHLTAADQADSSCAVGKQRGVHAHLYEPTDTSELPLNGKFMILCEIVNFSERNGGKWWTIEEMLMNRSNKGAAETIRG